ncbi:MAG: helix-turn-helix domain-containing protein [Anaerolineae bacterium]|nr:helix-turn-helix domain-containing protein [Anaerolineae bacterium]
MDNKLSTWIVEQLRDRGWSHRELGRRAGVSGAAVSRVISGEQNPGWDFCAGVAKALGEPPERLFRLAGLLPPEPNPAQEEGKLVAAYRQLSSQKQQFLLESVRGLQGRPAGPPAIRESPAPYELPPIPPVPDDEHIMELFKALESFRQRFVYDFARWQLKEQLNPLNSSSERQRKLQEWQENVDLINLMTAVDDATPQDRDGFIAFLQARYESKSGAE